MHPQLGFFFFEYSMFRSTLCLYSKIIFTLIILYERIACIANRQMGRLTIKYKYRDTTGGDRSDGSK